MSKTEVEAKFLVRDPALFKAAAALRELGPFRVVSRRRERQRNIYLDTDDWALKRGHAVLKIRRVGKKAEATFKKEFRYQRGVSRRLEITVPIPGGKVNRFLKNQHRAAPFQRAKVLAGTRQLKRIFTLLTDRRRRILSDGKSRAELDLDRVTVGQDSKRFTHLEVEMENLSCSPRAFRGLLATLRRRFGTGLRPSRVWKAEYGFRLFTRRKRK